MNLKRITRLLKLLQTLQAGNGQNAEGMARACGVSRRTVFRDLETLRAAGVPLEFDKDEDRYWIAGDFFLPPTNFTPAEALSIIALASQLGADDRLPFFRPARSAALKLQGSLPPPLRNELQRIAKSIHLRINAIDRLAGQESVYHQLVDAIATRRVVRITYGSLTEWEVIRTKLRPYQLVFNRHTWYVIGRSSLHREPRTFNLGRIRSLEHDEREICHAARLQRRTASRQCLESYAAAGGRLPGHRAFPAPRGAKRRRGGLAQDAEACIS